jgi:hypothetical protein
MKSKVSSEEQTGEIDDTKPAAVRQDGDSVQVLRAIFVFVRLNTQGREFAAD